MNILWNFSIISRSKVTSLDEKTVLHDPVSRENVFTVYYTVYDRCMIIAWLYNVLITLLLSILSVQKLSIRLATQSIKSLSLPDCWAILELVKPIRWTNDEGLFDGAML